MHDPFLEFARSLRNETRLSPLAALDRLCGRVIGHKLFSCSMFKIDDNAEGTAARIYTSDEENYPTSGLKQITPNRWTRIVIEQSEVFVANRAEDFSDVFPDHALICSLGLGSVVNLPVIVQGAFLGTVNLLHEKSYFTQRRLDILGHVEIAAQLAFVTKKDLAIPTNK